MAQLVPELAARRTEIEDAEAKITEFRQGGATDDQMTLLFSGLFNRINTTRTSLISGIARYGLKQQALSEQIDTMGAELREAKAEVASDDYDALDRIEELEDKLRWDTRIYDDRRQSLTFVCESPVLLEQRLFALGRIIAGQLE